MQKTLFDGAHARELMRRLPLLDDVPASSASQRRGIERESLRVDLHGRLALTPHPRALGAALTHPELTTDYSEALLEFITPAFARLPEVFERLRELHRFVVENLDKELLWPLSMPARLPADQEIPIADYGSSNLGRFKTVYRNGLSLRYGRTMQCIAGLHFNYSLDDGVWRALQSEAGADSDASSFEAFRSAGYFALMRNFEHYGWLLLYLFGASPALHPSFLQGRQPRGIELVKRGADTLIAPQATSLRMSDLGYQNRSVQGHQRPQYDALPAYLDALAEAVGTPYEPYQRLGVRDAAGNWLQLNANLLQIENELYATIRPKRAMQGDERPFTALARRGVQYVEARTLDLDPFDAVGISELTGRFMEAFMTFCALLPAPAVDTRAEDERNFVRVAKIGRRPGLMLEREQAELGLQDWGQAILDQVAKVAAQLDAVHGDTRYGEAVERQRAKLKDVSKTPSAQMLAAMEHGQMSFLEFGISQARKFAGTLKDEGSSIETHRRLSELAQRSRTAQGELEADDTLDFERYVAARSALTR